MPLFENCKAKMENSLYRTTARHPPSCKKFFTRSLERYFLYITTSLRSKALLLVASLALAMATPAHAACTGPAGVEGQTQYDFTNHVLQYCNDTSWVAAGGGSASIPTGAIWAFDLAACPTGWSEYTAARGRFLRGIDNGAGNDPDGTRAAGATQVDALQNIWGGFKVAGAGGGVDATSGAFTTGSYTGVAMSPTSGGSYTALFDASRVVRTSNETRPKNVAVLFCRKN